ncbi:hypothetical protein J6590_038959 [Homalodisca vitripennis]|nr:hypothetical protein J6590_038959 [Homalodisca vitripennis]
MQQFPDNNGVSPNNRQPGLPTGDKLVCQGLSAVCALDYGAYRLDSVFTQIPVTEQTGALLLEWTVSHLIQS